MEKSIYEIITDKIRNLEIYKENKQIFKVASHLDTAEYLMHKFFLENDYGFIMASLNSLESEIKDFLENYLYELENTDFLRLRIIKDVAETIKQLGDNSLEVITGCYPDPADNRKIKLSTKKVKKADFLKDLNFDDITKESAISLFLTAFKGGDIFESNYGKVSEWHHIAEYDLSKKENMREFIKYYRAERAKQGTTFKHGRTLDGFAELKSICSNTIRNYFEKIKPKIKELYPDELFNQPMDYFKILKENDADRL